MNDAPGKYQIIAERLAVDGWVIVPNFVSEELAQSLRNEALSLYRDGAFRAAGVGKGESWKLVPEIRNDQVLWLTKPFSDVQARYLAELEMLRLAINRTLFLGLWDFEGHYTLYAPGSRYQRHLDQFNYAKQRRVTCIAYLNDNWRPEDGGQLRIYLHGEKETPFLDVLPGSGTFACFLSDGFYHEVLPATRERLSVTGWFRTRE
jgi:SM-20-related protein